MRAFTAPPSHNAALTGIIYFINTVLLRPSTPSNLTHDTNLTLDTNSELDKYDTTLPALTVAPGGMLCWLDSSWDSMLSSLQWPNTPMGG